jgi:hypothetical protein
MEAKGIGVLRPRAAVESFKSRGLCYPKAAVFATPEENEQ